MKHFFSIKLLLLLCIIVSLTSCSANWFGGIWDEFNSDRSKLEMYTKEAYSIKGTEYCKDINLEYRPLVFGGFSYFNALKKGGSNYRIYEIDINLVEKTGLIISDELKKSQRSISKNEELFFHLDTKLLDNGLSTFRKDLITHDDLINYVPVLDDEVSVFFAIAEISEDNYCVYINSTSVQMFVYDKDGIIYKNALGVINLYRYNLSSNFISKREEDIKFAVGLLLDSFNEAYK